MADTTPVRAHGTPAEGSTPFDLLTYRLKQVEKNSERAVDQNGEILIILSDMKTQMALGNQRFDAIEKTAENHELRITATEADKRGVAGILAGIGGFIAAVGAYFR